MALLADGINKVDRPVMARRIMHTSVVRECVGRIELPRNLLHLEPAAKNCFLDPKLTTFQVFHLAAALAVNHTVSRGA